MDVSEPVGEVNMEERLPDPETGIAPNSSELQPHPALQTYSRVTPHYSPPDLILGSSITDQSRKKSNSFQIASCPPYDDSTSALEVDFLTGSSSLNYAKSTVGSMAWSPTESQTYQSPQSRIEALLRARRETRKMKRKAGRTEESPSAKSYVAEERMAAQLEALSLDGEKNTEQREINTSWADRLAGLDRNSKKSETSDSSDEDDMPRLQLGSLLKKELQKSTDRMRRAFFADFEASRPVPCRELVLWQPKPDLLKEALRQSDVHSDDTTTSLSSSTDSSSYDVIPRPQLQTDAGPGVSSVDIAPLGDISDDASSSLYSINDIPLSQPDSLLNSESGEIEHNIIDMEL